MYMMEFAARIARSSYEYFFIEKLYYIYEVKTFYILNFYDFFVCLLIYIKFDSDFLYITILL